MSKQYFHRPDSAHISSNILFLFITNLTPIEYKPDILLCYFISWSDIYYRTIFMVKNLSQSLTEHRSLSHEKMKICAKYHGDPSHWTKIFILNSYPWKTIVIHGIKSALHADEWSLSCQILTKSIMFFQTYVYKKKSNKINIFLTSALITKYSLIILFKKYLYLRGTNQISFCC